MTRSMHLSLSYPILLKIDPCILKILKSDTKMREWNPLPHFSKVDRQNKYYRLPQYYLMAEVASPKLPPDI